MRKRKSIALLVVLAALLGGCGRAPEPNIVEFAVPTQPQPAAAGAPCMSALAAGTLVADARWGVALSMENAPTLQVIWPNGFSGRMSIAGIELLDEQGTVVGRVGDHVRIGGGHVADGPWWACGPPERET